MKRGRTGRGIVVLKYWCASLVVVGFSVRVKAVVGFRRLYVYIMHKGT